MNEELPRPKEDVKSGRATPGEAMRSIELRARDNHYKKSRTWKWLERRRAL